MIVILCLTFVCSLCVDFMRRNCNLEVYLIICVGA